MISGLSCATALSAPRRAGLAGRGHSRSASAGQLPSSRARDRGRLTRQRACSLLAALLVQAGLALAAEPGTAATPAAPGLANPMGADRSAATLVGYNGAAEVGWSAEHPGSWTVSWIDRSWKFAHVGAGIRWRLPEPRGYDFAGRRIRFEALRNANADGLEVRLLLDGATRWSSGRLGLDNQKEYTLDVPASRFTAVIDTIEFRFTYANGAEVWWGRPLKATVLDFSSTATVASAPRPVPVRIEADTYAAVFCTDGRVELSARHPGGEALRVTTGGFALPGMALETGPNVTLRTAHQGTEAAGTVPVANVATALEDGSAAWPRVTLEYEVKEGAVSAEWTLLPQLARVVFRVQPGEGRPRRVGVAALDCQLAEGLAPVAMAKPSRWQRHPFGGVPYPLTAGTAECFQAGAATVIVATDHGVGRVLDQGRLNLHASEVSLPWRASELQAPAVFAFSDDPGTMPLAVALAGADRILLEVQSPEPFNLWSPAHSRLQVRARTVNLFHQALRLDLESIARDIDGRVIGQVALAQTLKPLQAWEVPLEVTAPDSGPIYVEVSARHNHAGAYQRVCLGLLPDYPFAAGPDSRFGISAYRGDAALHTEGRSEDQLLALMRRLGVRWLRLAGDRPLAHATGLHTWYQNGIPGDTAQPYFRGDRTTWLSDPAKRQDWLRANLQRAHDQGDLAFEFANEWNLYGGEESGTLAALHVTDWLVPLKRLRDAEFPGLALPGLVIANGDLTYLRQVHAAGGWDQFDALAFHASCGPRSADFDDGQTYWSFLATLRRLREALRLYGHKELWMSEFYAPTPPNSSCATNERAAAEELTLMCGLAVAAEVRGLMYYCLDDFMPEYEIRTAQQAGEPVEREQYFGLLRFDWNPKATLWAYQTAAYYLEGARFVGDVALPEPHLRGLLFEGNRGRVALLWSRLEGYRHHEEAHPRTTHRQPWEPHWDEETPLTVAAAQEGAPVTVVDCVGRARRLAPGVDNTVPLRLSGAPVYVLGGRFDATRGRFCDALGTP